MKKIKISELPLATSVDGLYSIGTDKSNNSVKFPVEDYVVDTVETDDADLAISDGSGYDIVQFSEGHIKTKNFDSSDITKRVEELEENDALETVETDDADLALSDGLGYDIVRFSDGHIKTKEFDSSNITGRVEALEEQEAQAVTVDTSLSTTSSNPIANKTITAALNEEVSALETVQESQQKDIKTLQTQVASISSESVVVDTELDASSSNPIANSAVTNALNNISGTAVDTALSSTSTNPVQNKAVKAALSELEETIKENIITVDDTVSSFSTNPVQNKVVKEYIDKAVSGASTSGDVISYTGQKLSIDSSVHRLSCEEMLNDQFYSQLGLKTWPGGMDIIDAAVVVTFNQGRIVLLDKDTYVAKAYGRLSTVSNNHANNCCWYWDNYYDDSSEYPLLYVSQCYTGSNKCYVEDLSVSGTSITSTLVQTITYSGSKFTAGLQWDWVIDNVQGYLYAHGYTAKGTSSNNAISSRIILRFAIPDWAEGGTVSLGDDDVLDTYEWTENYDYQGMQIVDGIMYSGSTRTTGHGADAEYETIQIHDLNNKRKLTHIELAGTYDLEIEGIAVYNNKLYVNMHRAVNNVNYADCHIYEITSID